ncbi:MAG: type I 3-dehydroquinate dehydratase [Oscillospiraceae bacterium]|nr:type I 3-dehydroquinate dehydratase [Oscillospiraceae bacterium]
MRKISSLPSPVLAGVVKEKTAKSAIAEINNCLYDGAGMIDLHMSCLENTDTETLRSIFSASKLPILALNYNVDYYGIPCGYNEEERIAMFRRAVDAGADGIDMQGYTFDLSAKENFKGEDKYSFTKGNPREIVTDEAVISKQCEFIEEIHSKGAEVLLSCHPGISMTAETVVELALFLERRGPDIIKIVTVAEKEEDLVESIRAMQLLKHEVKTKVSYHASGIAGSLSRIINPILGGHMIFCVDRYSESSIMEQLDLKTVKRIVEDLKKIK